MTVRREGNRVDVFYRCRKCRTARKGAPGKMFCDECGGVLDSIGYKGRLRDLPSPMKGRARRG